MCKEKCEVYARVVGFYTPVNQWNKGKNEERKMRTSMNLDPFRETQQEEKTVSSEESACP